jgi:hypothetical protein
MSYEVILTFVLKLECQAREENKTHRWPDNYSFWKSIFPEKKALQDIILWLPKPKSLAPRPAIRK